MKVHIIRADGTEEWVLLAAPIWSDPADSASRQIARLINAESLDAVNLRGGRVMWVDDGGYEARLVTHSPGHTELVPVRANKPVNAKATALYHNVCVPGTTHQIVGDVAIVGGKEF